MKRLHFLWFVFLVFIAGCSVYTELKPKPELSGMEQGNKNLRRDKKNFDLKRNNKYFIRFPKAPDPHFYLVLHFRDKSSLLQTLATEFNQKQRVVSAISDQTHQPDSVSVFAVDSSAAQYFWVIDSVLADHPLDMSYRYVPVWRYQYEIKSAEMKNSLTAHSIDSSNYHNLNTSFHFEKFDYDGEIRLIQKNTAVLEDVLAALEEIKKTFPSAILSSDDPAYLDYTELRSRLETELKFQSAYLKVVDMFSAEYKSRGDTRAFIGVLPKINSFFENHSLFEANVMLEAKTVVNRRLKEISEYYLAYIRQKNNTQPVPLEIGQVEILHRLCNGSVADEFRSIAEFVAAFNQYAEPLQDVPFRIAKIRTDEQQGPPWPDDTFYPHLTAAVTALKNKVSDIPISVFRSFQSEHCVSLLITETGAYRQTLTELETQFAKASEAVRQVNVIKNHSTYREVIRVLKKNKELAFLLAHYADADDLSLNQQKSLIEGSLRDSNWALCENSLAALYADQEFMNYAAVKEKKMFLVREMENSLHTQVERLSVKRAGDFITASLLATDNIDAMYQNEAFTPVHEIRFSTLGEKEAARRKQALSAKLQDIRTDLFPSSAVEALYKNFTANISQNGVAKARAVAKHGFFYKGKDRKILNLIAECDTRIAKWITKAASYRKFYVLPVTDNAKGENEYLFRLNVQIESDAEFPVFDVNVRLPEEVSRSASRQQWYREITINKKPIRNEGRFTISAPTSENGYESVITPVQMNKGTDNILEVRFNHASFKVFEISVMAQKPLIKKN